MTDTIKTRHVSAHHAQQGTEGEIAKMAEKHHGQFMAVLDAGYKMKADRDLHAAAADLYMQERDEWEARAEKAEAERDLHASTAVLAYEERDEWKERAEKAERERDAIVAISVDWMVASINGLRTTVLGHDSNDNPVHHVTRNEVIRILRSAPAAIEGAKPLMDRMLAAAKAEGLREAAGIAQHHRDHAGRDQDGEYYCGDEAAIWGGQVANGIADAILARAKEVEGK